MMKQLCPHFTHGPRYPVRGFVLSRRQKVFEEDLEIPTQEEVNEQLLTKREPICTVGSDDLPELRERLKNREMLLLRREEREKKSQRVPRRQLRDCLVWGKDGHFTRECGLREMEVAVSRASLESQQTIPKDV